MPKYPYKSQMEYKMGGAKHKMGGANQVLLTTPMTSFLLSYDVIHANGYMLEYKHFSAMCKSAAMILMQRNGKKVVPSKLISSLVMI